MNNERLAISETTDGKPPREGFETEAAPAPINPKTGQHEAYWVLSAAERAKGFVRPVRCTYIHVGCRPKYPVRVLTEEEHERYDQFGYVRYEEYPADPDSATCGRYWTEKDLKSGCRTTTTMGRALAETYARDPSYYGSTFCCHCGTHLPVAEFNWCDENGRDTGEVLGS